MWYPALLFWQHQINQEVSYQQSVLKCANEKNCKSSSITWSRGVHEHHPSTPIAIFPHGRLKRANGKPNLSDSKLQGIRRADFESWNLDPAVGDMGVGANLEVSILLVPPSILTARHWPHSIRTSSSASNCLHLRSVAVSSITE